jgi:hypothetical protein
MDGQTLAIPPGASIAKHMECGGKRSATPLWSERAGLNQQKRRRRFALAAHSKGCYFPDPSAVDSLQTRQFSFHS